MHDASIDSRPRDVLALPLPQLAGVPLSSRLLEDR